MVVLILFAAVPATASPLAGPCAPGAAYDPACDANQDGQITISDIQLTAGHWNQSGAFTSDNDHNHLGQTWTGSNNPLTIDGSFTLPLATAALVLSNAAWGDGLRVSSAGKVGVNVVSAGGDGLRVTMAGSASSAQLNTTNDGFEVAGAEGNGLYVGRADAAGVSITSAGGDGLRVGQAGDNGIQLDSASHNGVSIHQAGQPSAFFYSNNNNNGLEVEGAAGNGLYIGRADSNGLYVDSVGINGLHVNSANIGLYVTSAGSYGVYVGSAGYDGVYANTDRASGQWGFNTPDGINGSNVLFQSLSLVAQVSGPDGLTAGDIVAVAGVTDPVSGSTVHTPLVRLAGASFANIVGVVESHLALTQHPNRSQPTEGETDGEASPPVLRSVDGPAQAGDYVAITVMGAALVKVQDGEALQPGQRVTVGADGAARALGTLNVQLAGGEGTADIAESAPTVGVVLEAPKDGMVWVLVNPQ